TLGHALPLRANGPPVPGDESVAINLRRAYGVGMGASLAERGTMFAVSAAAWPRAATVSAEGLRIALFSGNYNCVRDGANRALNRVVAHLIARGAAVRVYSPTIDYPAFAPAGDLVSVPSFGIPGRSEYRVALGLPAAIRRD